MPIRSSPGLKRSHHGYVVLAFVILTLVVLITLGSLNNGDHSRIRSGGDETTGALRGLVRRAQDAVSEQQLPHDPTSLQPKAAKPSHRHLSRKGAQASEVHSHSAQYERAESESSVSLYCAQRSSSRPYAASCSSCSEAFFRASRSG